MKMSAIFTLVLVIINFFTHASEVKIDPECLNRSYYGHYCHKHLDDDTEVRQMGRLSEIQDLLKLIPATGFECRRCGAPSIYFGYIDPAFRKYNYHLKNQLNYCKKKPECKCLWPEYSLEAAAISNLAYELFYDLIEHTAMRILQDNFIKQNVFIGNPLYVLNDHKLVVSFIAHQFKFSDYYQVCLDVENYAKFVFDDIQFNKIKDKLDNIIEILYQQFFNLYINCYNAHPSQEIYKEIQFIKFVSNDVIDTSPLCSSKKEINGIQPQAFLNVYYHNADEIKEDLKRNWNIFAQEANALVEQGTILNDFLSYKNAIEILTKAIALDPANKTAYIERARAYFETNQLELALNDFKEVKRLIKLPPYKCHIGNFPEAVILMPESQLEFCNGLIIGILNGTKDSTTEFVPSVFSSCRGILNGLWAFACSPQEVSSEFINSAYILAEFVSTQSVYGCVQCIVPELRELVSSWHDLNDTLKGQKIGYIIGKYGLDIFIPGAIFKGVSKLRALKRANTMLTLEICSLSNLKKTKILEECSKRAKLREKIIFESLKKNTILLKDSNTIYHIMQKKHCWEKIIKLTGNTEVDCQTLLKFLEKHKVYLEKNRIETRILTEKLVHWRHRISIEGEQIIVEFIKNLETEEVFLNNAWVVSKS